MTEVAKPPAVPGSVWAKAQEIPLDQIEPDPENPNQMDDQTFSMLCEEIEKFGFDEPILLRPHPDGKKTTDGRPVYMLIGGEHRWKAAKVLQMKALPSVMKEGLSDFEVKTMMVRRNLIHGDLDKVKFTKLARRIMDQEKMDKTMLAAKMGMKDEGEFSKHYVEEVKKQNTKTQELLDSTRKEIVAVDNLSTVLHEIMEKHGNTLPKGYVYFFRGQKRVLMVMCEPALEDALEEMVAMLGRGEREVNEFLEDAIREKLEKVAEGMTTGGDPQVDPPVAPPDGA